MYIIAMTHLMNMNPYALLPVQLICLPVLMDRNASQNLNFAMGMGIMVVMIFQTTTLLGATTVLMTIYLSVREVVLMFV